MAKLLKLRYLDPSQGEKGTYVEVYCDHNDKRGYFRRLPKSDVDAKDTAIRVQKDELYEVRLLGTGWKSVNRPTFQRNLNVINTERIAKGWDPVVLPDAVEK